MTYFVDSSVLIKISNLEIKSFCVTLTDNTQDSSLAKILVY